MKLNRNGYLVITLNGWNWKVGFSDEIDSFGETNEIDFTIKINGILRGNKYQLKNTITHELVHAYVASYGVYPNKIGELSMTEEQLCCFVASNADKIIELSDKIYNCLIEVRAKNE